MYFANMALLDRRTCRMVAESGGHDCKSPLPVAAGAAGNSGCRILYISYSSTPAPASWQGRTTSPGLPFNDSNPLRPSPQIPDHTKEPPASDTQ